MESLAVASHPLQDLNRQSGSGEPPLPKSIDQKKAPGGFLLPALVSLGAEVSVALLNFDHKRDVTVGQVDTERIGRVLLEIARGHIEYPDATAIAEGNVRNIVKCIFVRVRNLAADCTQHS